MPTRPNWLWWYSCGSPQGWMRRRIDSFPRIELWQQACLRLQLGIHIYERPEFTAGAGSLPRSSEAERDEGRQNEEDLGENSFTHYSSPHPLKPAKRNQQRPAVEIPNRHDLIHALRPWPIENVNQQEPSQFSKLTVRAVCCQRSPFRLKMR